MIKRMVKYNPAFLSKEELLRSFVVRHAELELIVQALRENVTKSNQHVLVIGPRGTGKTMLVLRVVEEVRTEKDLSKRWYPLVFSEESYQVTTPGEFWLEALFHLGQKTGEACWKQTYRELSSDQDENRLRERALGQLMDFADTKGKRILIVVENFNMLIGEQLSDNDGWALRHTLLNEPRIMLLATATSRFEEIDNCGKPMFELFRTLELKPLDKKDCRVLWTSVTGKKPSDKRVRPLQILTGGNPRLLAIVSTFAVRMSLKELMSDLMQLVDEHTEYFKSHLDNLPAIERKVYIGLAELWKPATAREVANLARLNVNKTSSLLRRLMERGAVVLADGRKRTKLYQVAERMYNIYYLMRRRGAPSRRVKALVRFMANFYEEEQLVSLAARIAEEACGLEPALRKDHYYAFEGIVQRVTSEQLRGIIIKSAPVDFLDMPDTPASIKNLAGFEGMKDVHALLAGSKDLPEIKDELQKAEKLFHKAIEASPNDPKLLAFHGLLLILLELYEEAEEQLRKAIETAPDEPMSWIFHGALLTMLERYDEAEKAYRNAIKLDEKYTWAWALLGQLLNEKLERHDEAENAYLKAIELDEKSAWTWANMGLLLHEKLERYDEAEKAYRKVIELDEKNAWAWAYLGLLLYEKLERYDEAEKAFRKVIGLDPTAGSWAWLALAELFIAKSERYDEAKEALRKAMEFDSIAPTAMNKFVNLVLEQGKTAEEALETLKGYLAKPQRVEQSVDITTESVVKLAASGYGREVLEIVSESPSSKILEPLVVGLQLFVSEDVKAAAEIMEVARDVVKRIEERRDKMQPKPRMKRRTKHKRKSAE